MTRSLTVTATHPAPEGLSTLGALIHPLSPEYFKAVLWQRQPVHLTGWAGRLAGVFDRESLSRVLAHQHEFGVSVRVSSDHVGDDGAAVAHVLVDGANLEDHLRAGTSVCVDPVDRADPAIARLVESLRCELGHTGPTSVKCYYSTPGFGFNTHFDAQVVLTLQIEGHKRWRVSPTPGVPFPVDNAFLDAAGEIHYVGRPPNSVRAWERPVVDRRDFTEVVLSPGDVLCLPAGTWHEAKATDQPSLALNFSFAPRDLLDLVCGLVRANLENRVSWRSGLPTGHDPADYLADRIGELIEELRLVALSDGLGERALVPVTRASPGRAQPAAAGLAEAARRSALWAGRRVQCVLGVQDARRAAEWYGRVLGSEVVSEIPEFGWVEVSTAVGGLTLGLTEVPTRVTNRGAVLDFEVDDVERVRALLSANGVEVEHPVTVIAGLARVLTAHDLDGNQLMFFEPESTNGHV